MLFSLFLPFSFWLENIEKRCRGPNSLEEEESALREGEESEEREESKAACFSLDASKRTKDNKTFNSSLTLTSLVPCAAAMTEETTSSASRSVKKDCWWGVERD